MSEPTVSSAAADNVSDKSDEGTESTPKTKTVNYSDHVRALDDMKKFKGRTAELEEKLAKIEEERLREKEDHKGLAEKYKNQAEEANQKLEKQTKTLMFTQRYQAVERAARSLGLRDEAVDDLASVLDEDKLNVSITDKGVFMVDGVDSFVTELKEKKPHWFKKDVVPKVNGGGGSAKPTEHKKLTPLDMVKAENDVLAKRISKEDYIAIKKRYLGQTANPR